MLSNVFTNLAIGMNSLLSDVAHLAEEPNKWVQEFVKIIFQILTWAGVLVAAAGTVYAIILGINMARADSAEKREEAKQRILYTIIGIIICVVLIIVFIIVSRNIETWLKALNNKK